jgi:hypothetical protein
MNVEPLTANLPPPVDDVDIATLLERARETDSDEVVRKLEAGLPRWQGPGDEGWMSQVAGAR